MDYENGMKYAGSREMYIANLKLWLMYTDERKSAVHKAYDERDVIRCRIEAHSLKSNAKGIGADVLAGIALRMEEAAKNNDMETYGQLIGDLTEEWDRTDEAVLKYTGPVCDTPAQSDGTYMTLTQYFDCVSKIKESLAAFDSDNAAAVADIILGHEISADVRARITAIRKAAEDFDYHEALNLINALPSHP